MRDYRRVTMGIIFKLQKRSLRDLAWNYFVWGGENGTEKKCIYSPNRWKHHLLNIEPDMTFIIFWCCIEMLLIFLYFDQGNQSKYILGHFKW